MLRRTTVVARCSRRHAPAGGQSRYRLMAGQGLLLAKAGRYREATAWIRRALQALPERLARSADGQELARRLAEYRAAAEREEGAK